MVFFGKTSWQAPDLRPSNIVAQLRNTPLQQNFLRRRTGELRQYFFLASFGRDFQRDCAPSIRDILAYSPLLGRQKGAPGTSEVFAHYDVPLQQNNLRSRGQGLHGSKHLVQDRC